MSNLTSKVALAFKGIQVPIGKSIVQPKNPTQSGYAFKLKSKLFNGNKHVGGSDFRFKV